MGASGENALPRRRRRGSAPARGRDQCGGAISLWVVLMVPVSAFAAVVAMAGPQRVAAESSMQDAADDLAMLAVAWRDGQGPEADVGAPAGPLHAFPPECAARTVRQQNDLDDLKRRIEALDPSDPPPSQTVTDIGELDKDLWGPSTNPDWGPTGLLGQLGLPAPAGRPASNRAELLYEFTAAGNQLDQWDDACTLLFESLLRDLGNLGVDTFSLRGFYSDSLPESLGSLRGPPCRASDGTVAQDAVHVALSAHWRQAGWAAAQVWPQGTHVAAESIGRLSRHDTANSGIQHCSDGALTIIDESGRPKLEPSDPSREITRSVPRTPLSN